MKTCLLIDDEAKERIKVLKSELPQIEWKGFDYDRNREPRAQLLNALRQAEKNPPDLLWLDVVFHFNDGTWCLDDELIEKSLYLGPPVLVVSSLRDKIIEVINNNRDHLFHAPIDFVEYSPQKIDGIKSKIDLLLPDLPKINFESLNLTEWNLSGRKYHWRKTYLRTFAGKVDKDDKTGFNLTKDDPFVIANILSDYARKNSSKRNIDLSRGDPHYASSPKAAKCIHFWHQFSQLLQNEADKETGYEHSTVIDSVRFDKSNQAWADTLRIMNNQKDARDLAIAFQDVLQNLAVSVNEIPSSSNIRAQVVRALQGSTYGNRFGEPLVRAVFAHYLNYRLKFYDSKSSDLPLSYDNLILTNGGSTAIGVLFKMLEKLGLFAPRLEGVKNSQNGFLASFIPVYGPYNTIFERINLELWPILCKEANGYQPDLSTFEAMVKQGDKFKILVMVNPNNPTGINYPANFLDKLAQFVKDYGIIAVEDVAYFDYILSQDRKCETLFERIPEQTFLIGSLSKFFSATGSRCGYIAITDTCNDWLCRKFATKIKNANYTDAFCPEPDFRYAFSRAKSADLYSAFPHTEMVPKQVQFQGAMQVVHGIKDNEKNVTHLTITWKKFVSILGLEEPEKLLEYGNTRYFILVDFLPMIIKELEKKLSGNLEDKLKRNHKLANKFMLTLAKEGVVGLPAARFYLKEADQNIWKIRFSLVNQPQNKVVEGAKRIIKAVSRFAAENAVLLISA